MIENYAAYQLIFFSIAIFLILRSIYMYFRSKKSLREVIVAMFIWGGFGLLGLFPNLLDYVAKLTGFALGINALIIISLLVLFFAMFKQILYNDRLENSITRMVRQEALKDLIADDEKNSKK